MNIIFPTGNLDFEAKCLHGQSSVKPRELSLNRELLYRCIDAYCHLKKKKSGSLQACQRVWESIGRLCMDSSRLHLIPPPLIGPVAYPYCAIVINLSCEYKYILNTVSPCSEAWNTWVVLKPLTQQINDRESLMTLLKLPFRITICCRPFVPTITISLGGSCSPAG